ncbi:MAG: hypothetical protein E7012_06475 [Alphaproteobacteria bacterium]|nr:hypothetical protein [Alphaproteobacteria bacterium]
MKNLFLFVAYFVLYALVVTILGMCIGWFVGLLFGKTILGVLACIGIKGFKMWQIGATLAFLSSFFTNGWFKITFKDIDRYSFFGLK